MFTWKNNEKYGIIASLNKEIDEEKYNITCKIQNTYVQPTPLTFCERLKVATK